MARLSLRQKMRLVTVMLMHLDMMENILIMLIFVAMAMLHKNRNRSGHSLTYAGTFKHRHRIRSINLQGMVFDSDTQCVENCRMDRRAFHKLCQLLKTHGRIHSNRHTTVEEMVASFLQIVAHNVKNKVLKRQTARSGETVSRNFHVAKNPEPISENSTDERWKWFKNCLGALDGTYIRVQVDTIDKPRYRTRKGEIATNVLGVCTSSMQFIYVLAGWEGSVADGRVLRDAISRRNGLKVPQGHYYLCDAGYTNGEDLLASYRGQRYHLSDWR